ncbi:MAG: hypothetical protein R2785_02630 [Flavobacteriaceae bacterium]
MKRLFLFAVAVISFSSLTAQQFLEQDLKMISDVSSDNREVRDIMDFQGIEYHKIKFTGKELPNKSYHITVKEIWNGKVVSDTTVFNSAKIGIEQFEKVNDTVLSFRVVSQLTHENKLKMSFIFPRFRVTKAYDALDTDMYSLRNVAQESGLEIGYDKKFYLLAYILPYKREDGSSSWCEVGTSGKDIENWGEKFGIEHYLLFEMKFE